MSTNGHHPITIDCERCEVGGLPSAEELLIHLVDDHLMPLEQAKQEAQGRKLNKRFKRDRLLAAQGEGPAPQLVVPSTLPAPHHTCPTCETKIPCVWETAALMDEQARLLKLGAAQVRAKAMGQPWGAPRKNPTWNDQDVIAAWNAGLSVKAIADFFQAGQGTVSRALKRVGAK